MFVLWRAFEVWNRECKTFAAIRAVANYRVADVESRDEPARRVILEYAADIRREVSCLPDTKFADRELLIN